MDRLGAFQVLAEGGAPAAIAWSLALFGGVVVLFVVVSLLKRWFRADEPETVQPPGFTLDDLRELHRQGKLSTEEFERAKGRMLAATQAAAARRAEPDG